MKGEVGSGWQEEGEGRVFQGGGWQGEGREVGVVGLLGGPEESDETPFQLFWEQEYENPYIFYFYISPFFVIFYTISGDKIHIPFSYIPHSQT